MFKKSPFGFSEGLYYVVKYKSFVMLNIYFTFELLPSIMYAINVHGPPENPITGISEFKVVTVSVMES